MPTDLTDSKKGTGSVWPDGAIDAAGGLERVEAILTPKQLEDRFLWGFPLVSPITKQKLTPQMMQDAIKRAANQFELDSKTFVSPVVIRQRLPFDPNMYYQYIYLEFPQKPIQRVIRMAICSASYAGNNFPGDDAPANESLQYPSGAQIYRIPNDWVEMGNARKGRLNVIPINPAFTAISSSDAVQGTGSAVLAFIGALGWVPSYWTVEAVVGFCTEDGNVPVIVNEAIGAMAAILLLNNLIPLYRITSQSLSIDGLGQSNTDNLQQLLKQKRDDLVQQYEHLVKQIKTLTNNKIVSSNV